MGVADRLNTTKMLSSCVCKLPTLLICLKIKTGAMFLAKCCSDIIYITVTMTVTLHECMYFFIMIILCDGLFSDKYCALGCNLLRYLKTQRHKRGLLHTILEINLYN